MTLLGTERQFNFQWREEQRAGNYPFADGCSLLTTELLDVGSDTFVDAHLYPIGADARLRITSIVVASDLVTIFVGTDAVPATCSGVFDPLAPPEIVRLLDTLGRPAGVLVADELSLSRFQSWDKKTHNFTSQAAEFVASVCCPAPEVGVRALATVDGDLLTGEVWIVGENGLVVREDPDESIPGATLLRIDIVGDPLFQRKLCNGVASNPGGDVPLFQTPHILRTINHQPAGQYGHYLLAVGRNVSLDPILRIQNDGDSLHVYLVGQLTQNGT